MKKLRVDLDEIASAMENNDCSTIDFYLDTKTGQVIALQTEIFDMIEDDEFLEDLSDWEKEEIPIVKEIVNSDSDRYIQIPEKPSYEGYNLMVEFAEKVEDDSLKEKFAIALNGRGAFGRFKQVLSGYPNYRESWYKFKDERIKKDVLDWLNEIGIEPVVEKEVSV